MEEDIPVSFKWKELKLYVTFAYLRNNARYDEPNYHYNTSLVELLLESLPRRANG